MGLCVHDPIHSRMVLPRSRHRYRSGSINSSRSSLSTSICSNLQQDLPASWTTRPSPGLGVGSSRARPRKSEDSHTGPTTSKTCFGAELGAVSSAVSTNRRSVGGVTPAYGMRKGWMSKCREISQERSLTNVLVGVIERGSDECRHGAVNDGKVLVSVCLDPSDSVD